MKGKEAKFLALLMLTASFLSAEEKSFAQDPPSSEKPSFPIAVWLQNPANAARYKAAGINLYVGLYNGPTSNQLGALRKPGVSVICGQRRGMEFKDDSTIVGWMHGDEPDNAQSLGQGLRV